MSRDHPGGREAQVDPATGLQAAAQRVHRARGRLTQTLGEQKRSGPHDGPDLFCTRSARRYRWTGETGTESSVNTGMLEVTGAGSTAAGIVTPCAASFASVSSAETGCPTVA